MKACLLLLMATLAPGAAGPAGVSGRVLDEGGRPIARAEVIVAYNQYPAAPAGYGDGFSRREISLRADGAGRFAVPKVGYIWGVFATAPDRGLAVAFVKADAPAPVTLTLRPARTVAGRVVDPDGAPVADARVRPSHFQTMGSEGEVTWCTVPDGLRERFAARTDATGAYRIAGMPPAGVRVGVSHPQFRDGSREIRAGADELRLRPGCRIRGRLLDGETGVPGWRVLAQSATNVYFRTEPAATGPDGAFLLSGLAPGKYDVLAQVPAGANRTAAAVSVDVSEEHPDAEVTLRAVAGGVISISTVDRKTRAPVADVHVRVRGPHTPRDLTEQYVRTGTDGTARLRVAPGLNTFSAWSPTGDHSALTATLDVREGQDAGLEIAVPTGVTLRGRVVGSDGKPAGGVAIELRGAGLIEKKATTASDGTFSIDRVAEMELMIKAERGSEGLPQPLTLKPPFPDPLNIALTPIPTVTYVGRVVDDRGRPVSGAKVQLFLMRRTGDRESWEYPGTAKTDRNGRYRFLVHDLSAEYCAYLHPGSYRTLSGGTSLGDGGAVRRLADLVVVSSSSSVSGRVVDAKGEPVRDVSVCWPFGRQRHWALTDADGRFRLEGLPEDPVNLVARDGYRAAAFARATPGSEVVLVLKE